MPVRFTYSLARYRSHGLLCRFARWLAVSVFAFDMSSLICLFSSVTMVGKGKYDFVTSRPLRNGILIAVAHSACCACSKPRLVPEVFKANVDNRGNTERRTEAASTAASKNFAEMLLRQ